MRLLHNLTFTLSYKEPEKNDDMKEKEKFDGAKVYKMGLCKSHDKQDIKHFANIMPFLLLLLGSKKELSDLETGVVSLTRERLTDEAIKSADRLQKGNLQEASRVQKDISKYKSMSNKEVIKRVDDSKIPWERVEREFVKSRKARDCMVQWTNFFHPKFVGLKWTKEQDKQLLSLVEEYDGRDWIRISEELNSTVKQQQQKTTH